MSRSNDDTFDAVEVTSEVQLPATSAIPTFNAAVKAPKKRKRDKESRSSDDTFDAIENISEVQLPTTSANPTFNPAIKIPKKKKRDKEIKPNEKLAEDDSTQVNAIFPNIFR